MAYSTPDIKVVIADDHEIFREGIRLTLSRTPDIQLVAEATNGLELIAAVEAYQPDVVITDISMPGMDGLQSTRELVSRYPTLGIVGLSMFGEDDLIVEMLETGARGYLLKDADKEEIIEAIRTVYKGERYYCKHSGRKLAEMVGALKYHPHQKKVRPEFSKKEIDIIKLICKEFTNKEIGDQLFLSVRTVEGYRLKIQEKMHVKNSVGMVVYAMQHRLFDPNKD